MNSPIWKEEPKGHHRFCLVHVRKNVLQNHKGIMVKRLVWKMGIATKKRKFKKRRRLLRDVNNEALQYLDTVDKEKWNLAYDNHKRWGEMTTNMVESYNNVLRGARELPIKACIDMTFWRTIEWFNQRSIASTQCATPLTPWAHEKVCKNDAKGQLHNVRAPSTIRGIYVVRTQRRVGGKGGNKWKVKYLESNCKCQKRQMWRLPCSHAAAVVRFRNDNMLSLVNPVYHTSVWVHQYSGVFNPLRHPDYWDVPEWTLQYSRRQLLPRSRCRYRTTRIPNQMDVREADQPRARRKCKSCRQPGHDRRNCPTS
ncbi:uncharacterized protein LOC125194964 [Salvia hispanica]|uniref:uncharacterized protein LOC125194964 n=1 Tax=Salvia hispanica TaxID=49212 RepID=UPI002009901E|nr:uncharacterized protein LOC125194964 [Salvia hispanica]